MGQHTLAAAVAWPRSAPPSLNAFSATQVLTQPEALGVERSSPPPWTPFYPLAILLKALPGPRKLRKCSRRDLLPPSSTPQSTAAAVVPLCPGRLPRLGTLRMKAAARSLTHTQLHHTFFLFTRFAGRRLSRELSGIPIATLIFLQGS